jgi:hypothetical protein
MLPNPQHEPAAVAQASHDKAGPLFIALDFLVPVTSIRLRHTQVFWTTMPEAAVNKDNDALAAKDEVGAAG